MKFKREMVESGGSVVRVVESVVECGGSVVEILADS